MSVRFFSTDNLKHIDEYLSVCDMYMFGLQLSIQTSFQKKLASSNGSTANVAEGYASGNGCSSNRLYIDMSNCFPAKHCFAGVYLYLLVISYCMLKDL